MLAMVEEETHAGRPDIKRSAAVMALMQRKTLLQDDTHEKIYLDNGHLVRAGDTTHHHLPPVGEDDEDEGGGRHSISRFDPEVR